LVTSIIINVETAEWITHMSTGNIMKKYRVSIWTSVDVEAENENKAAEIAEDMFIGGAIKNREFFFDPEENEH